VARAAVKIKPTKRPKVRVVPVKRPKATPKFFPAVDAKGRPFKVGQRVRTGAGDILKVERIFAYQQWEVVHCRTEDGDLSQPHLPWCTILDDAPPRSLRDRLRGLRA
jgi:hypothetical protein